ncbi:uncharacterized protein LOC115319397 [Ixodes scapularis]|uniref:uncharacterized protein LOC115319397 n=1 Tax=Ixodes scapularis TaxID=6945 RepID=UPI001C386526|nr:uncharacterized protein LOC115319397 [Ixodes scapularis]
MSFSGLAPPPPFLPAPGRPAVAWPQWLRMFETFLLASGASDFTPERRKALLLHSLRLEGQRIFFSLPPSSDTSEDSGKPSPALSSYDQAVAVLTQHFASASNVVVERHKFRRRVQQPGESALEYVAALRELATRCSFAALEDSLRDQFLEGIVSQHLRERLLLEGSALSFSRAVLLAQQLEQAAQEVREFTPSQVQRAPPGPPAKVNCLMTTVTLSALSARADHLILRRSASAAVPASIVLHHRAARRNISAAFTAVGVAIFAPSATSYNTRPRSPWLKLTAATHPMMTKF